MSPPPSADGLGVSPNPTTTFSERAVRGGCNRHRRRHRQSPQVHAGRLVAVLRILPQALQNDAFQLRDAHEGITTARPPCSCSTPSSLSAYWTVKSSRRESVERLIQTTCAARSLRCEFLPSQHAASRGKSGRMCNVLHTPGLKASFLSPLPSSEEGLYPLSFGLRIGNKAARHQHGLSSLQLFGGLVLVIDCCGGKTWS